MKISAKFIIISFVIGFATAWAYDEFKTRRNASK